MGVHDGARQVHPVVIEEVRDLGEPLGNLPHLFQRLRRHLIGQVLGQSVLIGAEADGVAQIRGGAEEVDASSRQ